MAVHNRRGDLWIIVYGKVYDVTHFDDHPGGWTLFLDHAGKDASAPFEGHASETIRDILPRYYVGDVVENAPTKKEDKED